jgi:hypothetical protein
VGLGLPRAYDAMARAEGGLSIDANLGGGCVVTLSLEEELHHLPLMRPTPPGVGAHRDLASLHLTSRQKQLLMLLADRGSAGPSLVARELKIGLSTAYRALSNLEELGLVEPLGRGKRALSSAASEALMELLRAPE